MAMDLKTAAKLEYAKCASDALYFIKKHVKIQHPIRGTIPFNLFPFQEDTLGKFQTNPKSIVLKSRQMGISTLIAAYTLWMMLFQDDKNILIISIKQETAKEIVSKVRFANDHLPSYLKRRCIEDNRLSLKFSNGSKVLATSSSGDAARSFALSLLIIDEAAFIDDIEDIWTSAFPTLSTGGRAIILSTPNGVGNFFHRMWVKAESKENEFIPIKLPWDLHPERNEAWRKEQNKAYKSDKEAAQELDCDFLTSGNSVVDLEIILEYRKNKSKEPRYRAGFDSNLWVWKDWDYNPNTQFIVSADVARGDGADYSACQVFDIETLTQHAEYKGQLGPKEYGNMLVEICTKYNDALLVVENLSVGFATIQQIIDREYGNLFYSSPDLVYVDTMRQMTNKYYSAEKKMGPGFTTTSKTRPLIIGKMANYFREGTVNVFSTRLLDELMVFIWDKGKAQASQGYNDDLVMSLSFLLWVRDMSLRLQHEGIFLTKNLLNSIKQNTSSLELSKNALKSTYNNAHNQWNMKLGTSDQKSENLFWLL